MASAIILGFVILEIRESLGEKREKWTSWSEILIMKDNPNASGYMLADGSLQSIYFFLIDFLSPQFVDWLFLDYLIDPSTRFRFDQPLDRLHQPPRLIDRFDPEGEQSIREARVGEWNAGGKRRIITSMLGAFSAECTIAINPERELRISKARNISTCLFHLRLAEAHEQEMLSAKRSDFFCTLQ